MNKVCTQCNKNQPEWAFKQDGEICIFCNPQSVEIKPVKKHQAEIVEDKGCSGGGCTL